MTAWLATEWLAFDCEATGVDTDTARIVSAALVTVKGGMPVSSRTWLIDPGIDIPEAATAVHGITTEHAREHGEQPGPAVSDIAYLLRDARDKGTPAVMFNAPYDLSLLASECARHEFARPTVHPVLDALVLDKHVDRYRKGRRNLSAVCEHYGVPLGDDAHGAEADALAAARVVWKIATTHPLLATMTLDQLHEAQIGWALEQQDSLEAWFRNPKNPKCDPAATVERGWPLKIKREES